MSDLDLALLITLASGSYENYLDLKSKKDIDIYRSLICRFGERQTADIYKQFEVQKIKLSDKSILSPSHELYPTTFLHLRKPPLLLFTEGDLACLRNREFLSVVGSRQPSAYVLDWLDTQLRSFLVGIPLTIVSGGAIGIDRKASEVALGSGASTIIFLPSGLEALYPKYLEGLRGVPRLLFISEYFPGERMQKWHFHKRNRLIAALGSAVFATQLSIKGGTMITVRYALEQGKEIWTLPDFPGGTESSGNIQLLRDGATLIANSKDVEMAWSRVYPVLPKSVLFSPRPDC